MATLDMSPAVLDIVGVRANDANERIYKFTANGVPMDFTGYTLAAQARKKQTDPDPPALTAVITPVDVAAGVLSIAWPGEQVDTLLAGSTIWNGVWDFQVSTPTTKPVTIVAGKMRCDADVTRP